MSKVGALIMDCLCSTCAHDASLVWPADTSKYYTGLCQYCGENEGTLVPIDDMKTQEEAQASDELEALEEEADGDGIESVRARERLRSTYAPDLNDLELLNYEPVQIEAL